MEVATSIKTFLPHLDVLVVIRKQHLMSHLFPPVISMFYMKEMAKMGIRFARGYDVIGECGNPSPSFLDLSFVNKTKK